MTVRNRKATGETKSLPLCRTQTNSQKEYRIKNGCYKMQRKYFFTAAAELRKEIFILSTPQRSKRAGVRNTNTIHSGEKSKRTATEHSLNENLWKQKLSYKLKLNWKPAPVFGLRITSRALCRCGISIPSAHSRC